MKIQLDTENKTIKLESDETLADIVGVLEKLLPKGQWKEFTLETKTVINNWSNPVIIERFREQPYIRPWYCSTNAIGTNSQELDNKNLALGKYNIEA